MKKLTTILLIVLPMITWAHEDQYYTYKYDNVTIRFKTGFFFEEINNVKIVGEYVSLLCDSIHYDKPILLDFIHDYGHTYQGKTFSFLNIGSEEYELVSYYVQRYDSLLKENVYHMVPYSDSIENIKSVEKEVSVVPKINQQKKIVIRQFGFHFDITQTLNLVYYAIVNNAYVMNISRTDTLSSYLRNMYYKFETVPSNLVDSVKSTKTPIVESILQTKVYREVDSVDRHRLYYSYYSKNGYLIIFAGLHDKEITLDTLGQIYSFNPREYMPESLFVFETPNVFRKYELSTLFSDYEARRSKQHKIPINPYEYIVFVTIEWLGDDIYFINYNHSFMMSPFKRFPYLANDDVLIEDFESYINSYRMNEK